MRAPCATAGAGSAARIVAISAYPLTMPSTSIADLGSQVPASSTRKMRVSSRSRSRVRSIRRPAGDRAGTQRRVHRQRVLDVVGEERREAPELGEAEALQRLPLGLAETDHSAHHLVGLPEG